MMVDSTSVSKFELEIKYLADVCRICMIRGINMSSLFDNKENISEQVEFCVGIQLSKEDGLPANICDQCLHNLCVAYKFKTCCLKSEQQLRDLIDSKIKLETFDYSNDLDCDEIDYLSDVSCKPDLFEEESLETIKPMKYQSEKNSAKHIKKSKKRLLKIVGSKVKKKTEKKVTSKVSRSRINKCKYTQLLCAPCGIKFQTKREFEVHKKEVQHEAVYWICEICGKSYAHRSSHYHHVRTHQPPAYACEHCDYSTGHKHDLAKHLRVHSDVKLYQCEQCPATYRFSSNLTDHQRRQHAHLLRFACSLCDKRFYDKTKLNRHTDSHNGIKRFECEVCHSCFTRRCYWKKHLHRQHNILIPPQRPGRQKTDVVIERLINQGKSKSAEAK